MSNELKEGVQLEAVFGIPNADPQIGDSCWHVGEKPWQFKEIVVSLEPGQMAWVPWAKATTNEGKVIFINLANVEAVHLLEQKKSGPTRSTY